MGYRLRCVFRVRKLFSNSRVVLYSCNFTPKLLKSYWAQKEMHKHASRAYLKWPSPSCRQYAQAPPGHVSAFFVVDHLAASLLTFNLGIGSFVEQTFY